MIVVFGGNGQLGRELMYSAATRAIQMRALSHAEVDITDEVAVAAAFESCKPELVINAAAYTNVDLAERDVERSRQANEIGPAVLAHASAAAGIPMVHVSTDYVFDGAKEGAYSEADPVCPINLYGRTKTAGEDAVRDILKHHIILRTAWVYSRYGHNFLKTILRLAETRDELRIVADQFGSPTSAREIAQAILRIAPAFVREQSLAGTYHFTADGFTNWHGFAARVIDVAALITGRKPRVIAIGTADYPTAAKRPANSRLDCRLFAQKFGFSACHWTKGVDATTRTVAASSETAGSHVA